jgi:hypothetical protein
MRLAHIYYQQEERELVRRVIDQAQPSWEVDSLHEDQVSALPAVLDTLNAGYDAILVHLSLPFCLTLKAAELCHMNNHHTRVILFSRTKADCTAVDQLFDGVIRPDYDILRLPSLVESIVSAERDVLADPSELSDTIVTIFNSSLSLRLDFARITGLRDKDVYTLDDYKRAVYASMTDRPGGDAQTTDTDVFISYAHTDSAVAEEFREILEEHGLTSFMAEKTISGADVWEEAIRQALLRSKEMVVLVTPASLKSAWVMIEAGAAWVTRTPLTPCMLYGDIRDLPEPIARHQARGFRTREDRVRVAQEIRSRRRKHATQRARATGSAQ